MGEEKNADVRFQVKFFQPYVKSVKSGLLAFVGCVILNPKIGNELP